LACHRQTIANIGLEFVGVLMVIFYGQADFRVQNVAKLRNKLKRSITRQASYSSKDCSIQPAAALDRLR
jgi:hypothetical protein